MTVRRSRRGFTLHLQPGSLLMLLLLLACGGPTSGNYTFTVTDESSDCPESYTEAGSLDGQAQTITVSADEVVLEGDPSVSCERNGSSFHCPFDEADQTLDYADQGMDALYAVDTEMDGTWMSASSIDGSVSIATTCEGDDCEQLADAGAPACTMRWEFTAER